MIYAQGVSLKYQDGTIGLRNVNLNIENGDTVYITGPSGSGKTSLLKLFMGMEYPTEGSMTVMEQLIIPTEAKNIRKLRCVIGPVFQEFKLIRGRSVLENVMLGMRFLGISSECIRENAENSIIKVGLEHKMNSLVENLSWGESQRVAIARAVARKPSLILADEPTGNLDKDNAVKILELLNSFKDKSTTVIITTHATHLISGKKGDVFIHMNSGNLHYEKAGE